jgi:hypothetical protein
MIDTKGLVRCIEAVRPQTAKKSTYGGDMGRYHPKLPTL